MGNIHTKKKKADSVPSKVVTWFEIPVLDIDRATAFYNSIFSIEMDISDNGEFVMAFFPAADGIAGALVVGPGCVPSDTGPLLYLNGDPDLDKILSGIESAGGRVILPKTLVTEEAGYFALFMDTEGNRLALHSTA